MARASVRAVVEEAAERALEERLAQELARRASCSGIASSVEQLLRLALHETLPHELRGITRLRAASISRSRSVSCGHRGWRRRTDSSCPNTSSLSSFERWL